MDLMREARTRSTMIAGANYRLYASLFDKFRMIYNLRQVRSLKDLRSMLLKNEPYTEKGRDSYLGHLERKHRSLKSNRQQPT